MTETQHIQEQIHEMLCGAGGEMSVQTVAYSMRRLLEQEPEMSVGGAHIYLKFIMSSATHLSEEIEQWTYKGRFSEALFDHHYLQPGNDVLGIYTDLKGVLTALDATYQEQFRIASAVRFLFAVATYARILQSKLKRTSIEQQGEQA